MKELEQLLEKLNINHKDLSENDKNQILERLEIFLNLHQYEQSNIIDLIDNKTFHELRDFNCDEYIHEDDVEDNLTDKQAQNIVDNYFCHMDENEILDYFDIIPMENKNTTLFDKMKYDLLMENFNKYSLEQLEEIFKK